MQKAMTLARGGRAEYVIFREAQATPTEIYAVEELTRWLKAVSGATFRMQVGGKVPKKALVVKSDLHYADEEYVHLRKGEQLWLTGGQYRGVLYAVYKFLQDEVGIRWWAPWATDVPKKPMLAVVGKSKREKPAFESRNPFWYPAFNADWAARNFSNAQDAHLDTKHGGAVTYSGPSFVHTFYPFVPPEQHFSQHPEWFSEVEGKRTVDHGQLCTTNPELREFLVSQVRAQLSLVSFPRTPANEDALEVLIKSYDKLGLIQLRDDSQQILKLTFPESAYLAGVAPKPWWKIW